MTTIAKKAIVSGRVQGVFYRASTKNEALKLQLRGYAKNLPDGTVEVVAIGQDDNVEALVQWLWKGSRASKVTGVVTHDVADIDPSAYTTFSTG